MFRDPLRRRRGFLGLVAVLGVAALGAAGCTSSVTRVSPSKVARGIKLQLQNQIPDARVGDVTCPDPASIKVEQGTTFECSVAVDNQTLPVRVTLTNASSGEARFDYLKAVLDLAQLRKLVQDAYASKFGATVTADCGPGVVSVREPNDQLACTVAGDGKKAVADVTVRDVDGKVDVRANPLA